MMANIEGQYTLLSYIRKIVSRLNEEDSSPDHSPKRRKPYV